MAHAVSTDRDFQLDRLTESIVALWKDAAFAQTEAAAMLGRVVTHDEPRIPNEHEVRGYIREAVRGALVREPPAPRSPLQKIRHYLTKWED